jgi:perosamine synthetase
MPGIMQTRPDWIPVYRPDLSGNERAYVIDCIDSSWISSIGPYVDRFEEALRSITGAPHAICVSNGTVALHLALHSLGIGPGDEVIVPTFTFIASVNAIAHTGATPIFAESRASDWLIDPEKIEPLISQRTKAILPVHLYGAICDMPAIMEIAQKHGLHVVEDCAESLGSRFAGKHTGTIGDVGTFSFFGNKTITTGEGGAVITKDERLASRLRMAKGQGQSLTRRYWHEMLGFNYRMTNIQAAIGVAQCERLSNILARKHRIAKQYRALLADAPVTFQKPMDGIESSDWLVSILLPASVERERVMASMAERGVDTRPVFYCAHHMPMYASQRNTSGTPIAEAISARGLSLPSYPTLTEGEIARAANALKDAVSSPS